MVRTLCISWSSFLRWTKRPREIEHRIHRGVTSRTMARIYAPSFVGINAFKIAKPDADA